MPQLVASVCASTQRDPQSVRPVEHWHMPATHDAVRSQAFAQRPQLLMSVIVFTQRVPQ